jgi:hypothetical protein
MQRCHAIAHQIIIVLSSQQIKHKLNCRLCVLLCLGQMFDGTKQTSRGTTRAPVWRDHTGILTDR